MKRLIVCLSVLLMLVSFLPDLYAQDFFDGYIMQVIEADTFLLRGGTIVRCMGIDAPHVRGGNPQYLALAQRGLSFSKNLLEKQKVRLEFVDIDFLRNKSTTRFAYVFAKGQSVNALLLKKGFAILSKNYLASDKYYSFFYRKQNEAILTKSGIWKNMNSKNINNLRGESYGF